MDKWRVVIKFWSFAGFFDLSTGDLHEFRLTLFDILINLSIRAKFGIIMR